MQIKSLSDESGIRFLLAWYGGGLALGFKGDVDAIERCYNWATNTGVTRGTLQWLYDRASIGYVCIDNHASLLRGLISQFRAEIIMGREVPLLVDRWDDATESALIEYDEPRIEALATERANRFMAEQIEYVNFLTNLSTPVAPVHALGNLARAGAAAD